MTGEPMPVWNLIRHSMYHDSVTLMRVTRHLETLSDVRRAAVMMGTPANRTLLCQAGLLTADGESASPNDLIIAVEAEDQTAVQTAAATVERVFTTKTAATP